jgi:hypothetical protein
MIKDNIKIIQEQLNQIVNTVDESDNSNVFKYALISRIIQAGGTINTSMKNQENGDYKKFFAFKFDPSGDIENQILSNLERMFNLVDLYRHDSICDSWQDIEFNVPKLENLRDKDSFCDWYRGLVLYRKKVQ